ncbi:hypothetical protein BD560DRAFT_462304 [Blakeslea trispora]|nr:hypothetical protein BD560DRAFT_462304 [Blakeslea trispora]
MVFTCTSGNISARFCQHSSQHNPNNQPFQVATWAQRLRSFQRSTFDVGTTQSDTIFVEAKDSFSVTIDLTTLSGMNFQEKSLNSILRDQFPNGIGLRERKIGRQRLVEINFASEAARVQALSKPFMIQGETLKFEECLKPKLITLLSQYGDILEIGLRYIEDGHWFNGRGFVTSNRDKNKTFLPLSSQIPSWIKDHSICLSLKNMKPVCAYCHADNYLKASCPKLKPSRKACYLCGSYEHLRAKCPEASWNKNKKRSRNESPTPSRTLTLGTFLPPSLTSSDMNTEKEQTAIDLPKDISMEESPEVSEAEQSSVDLPCNSLELSNSPSTDNLEQFDMDIQSDLDFVILDFVITSILSYDLAPPTLGSM